VRPIHHPDVDELDLPHVLHALSDPVRLEIVRCLASGCERPCGDLIDSVAKSTLSHHLKVLREAGLTSTRPDGTTRLVSLRRAEVEDRFPGLLDCILEASRNGIRPIARHV
jgi:DNA-binding transcriptional ArsR family regulator